MNPASRKDHDNFCRNERWLLVRNARGGSVRHHVTYELVLEDGSILRTRISRPVNKTRYGHGLWAVILSRQLLVTEDEFWACVRNRTLPVRSRKPSYGEAQMLPAWLVFQLLSTVGLPESEVKKLSVDEAQQRLSDYWNTQDKPGR